MAYDDQGNLIPDPYSYATPEELASSGYNAPNSGDGYSYATPEELASSGYNAPNSGNGYQYATPAELASSGYNAPISGQGATGTNGIVGINAGTQPSPTPPTSGLSNLISNLGKAGSTALQTVAGKTSNLAGLGSLATSLGAIYAALNPSFKNPQSTGGYTGSIPHLTAMRTQLAQAPYQAYSGSSQPVMGRQFFSPTKYAAEGGMMGMAADGHAQAPQYLDGPTDGMGDKLNTSIDGIQPAKLSHGEFVIPADVVSHLGNGNSTAGADVLYKMMERVRKARTGNPKQGKEINPEKFTPGGIAGYAKGGPIAFVEGAQVPVATAPTTAPAATPYPYNPPTNVSNSSTLSQWAGPYVTNMLGQGQALANAPAPVYQGPLTAGTSPIQQQAFNTASNLPTSYNNTQVTSGLGPVGTIQSYMNPYMQGAVDVQNAAARRQSDITNTAEHAKLAQAGAYGGGRQAIEDSESARNLGILQNANELTGLNTAYNSAVQQQQAAANLGMTAQQATQQAQQFGANYGLSSLGAQETAGAQQRGIEQQGIDALHAQFEEQKADPYKQLQFQQSLLSGLPISTSTTTPNTSGISNFQDLMGNIGTLFGTTPPPVSNS